MTSSPTNPASGVERETQAVAPVDGEVLALRVYRHLTNYTEACAARRDNIEKVRDETVAALTRETPTPAGEGEDSPRARAFAETVYRETGGATPELKRLYAKLQDNERHTPAGETDGAVERLAVLAIRLENAGGVTVHVENPHVIASSLINVLAAQAADKAEIAELKKRAEVQANNVGVYLAMSERLHGENATLQARVGELEALTQDCLVELSRSQRPSHAWQLKAAALLQNKGEG